MAYTNASKIYKLVGAEAVLTEAEDLRKYLTGFSSSFGYVLSDKNGSTFYTDPRYLEAAERRLKARKLPLKSIRSLLIKFCQTINK